MKLWTLIFMAVLTLVSCTSEESKIQKAGIEAAQAELREQLSLKAHQKVQGKTDLQKAFVEQILQRTEFEVESINPSGSQAKVRLLVHTVPNQVQDSILEIIAKLDPAKERAFNVGDGIKLIYQEMNLDPQSKMNQKMNLLLIKDSDWRAEKALPRH